MSLQININGKSYDAQQGETILQVAERNGIDVPTLCHDPRLEPYSSCFLCVVEVSGMRGLQTACSTKISNGMHVLTHNDRVYKSRKMALDLLLSNHYADCMAPCKETCPAGVDVQGYISLIDKGMYSEAVGLIKEVNPLPAICGRVCVRPCEAACRRNLLDETNAVGIDYLKRFAADADLASDEHYKPEIAPETGKKVAIIGAGPGGLSAAYFLRQKGHEVAIYEAHKHAGGMLRYGIPEYRLPNDLLDQEVSTITELGVQIHYQQKLGESISYLQLQEQYDATVLTIGSQKGTLLGVDGEDAEGVYSGIDFLRNMEVTEQKYDFKGKKVAVVGGGNVAMDCCRTSFRCGAEKVYVIYRRTEAEMPANVIEIHESKLEGIEYLLLTNPTRVNKDEHGKLKSITLLRMQLGEPDKSGRRRPEPIEGSEFDLEIDLLLAAIGQKTQVDFINDINTHSTEGKLVINRWGDIDADRKTLQTGIPSMFAAGDGVTGPATLIEAIAQAGKASRSVHQYLMGEEVKSPVKEFLSKKDNFKPQTKELYVGKYARQLRQEMPVLDADLRLNFNEVELGYTEKQALSECQRCMECGCVEYHTCDLKKYATEYEVEQQRFKGDFQEHSVDFSHPYIEIDSNKCILCSRCVRICRDVVGANALGLVNRGFDTYVAPSMGKSLTDTDCESCGLCISTCPTGAISENTAFKPGPLALEEATMVSNYGSAGELITLHHRKGFVMKVSGAKGKINPEQNFSRQDKFGYNYLNDRSRITKPLLKTGGGQFKEISFDDAFRKIHERISGNDAEKTAILGGARLTNEELFLLKRLAIRGVKTSSAGSFHYMGRGDGYQSNMYHNVDFDKIKQADTVYVLGGQPDKDNPVLGFMLNDARKKGSRIVWITKDINADFARKVDKTILIKSYHYFTKSLNHFLLSNGFQDDEYLEEYTRSFEAYKEQLLKTNYDRLIEKSGVACQGTVVRIAGRFHNKEAIVVYSEKDLSANTCKELQHMAMICGQTGEEKGGLIAMKEKNNAQGLIELGLCNGSSDLYEKTLKGKFSTMLIFGEDPIGCAIDKKAIQEAIDKPDFLVVSDYFMTETAQMADLILPASFPIETGGSYANAQGMVQKFEKSRSFPVKVRKTTAEQIIDISQLFGVTGLKTTDEIQQEIFSMTQTYPPAFEFTDSGNPNRLFQYGCDYLEKRFADELRSNLPASDFFKEV